ncbi:MAG: YhbY family RNA-binding protein [Candidatus Hodarchaeota archaeon]
MKQESKENLRMIRQESPVLQIGKNGISPLLLKEIEEQLKRNAIIKIRFLKNGPYKNRSHAFHKLQQQLPNWIELLEVRGWTGILKNKIKG